ncbi:MAG: 4Fe-4S binding protein [Erysipelotrichaceae bacterium]|nr:4Fe-4S binding protein [Erysipelotrichaceae bacterium]
MENKKEFILKEISSSVMPVVYDPEKCVHCNSCVNVCQVDILYPRKDDTPIVVYPGECYYCGCCVMACTHDAIKLRHPLMNQTKFILKSDVEK